MSASSAAETFVQETRDGLDDLETRLIALEAKPSADQVDDIFRILHTIKGSAAMFGFEPLSRFTHRFETAFDLVREGKLGTSKALVDAALMSSDHMLRLLEANDDAEEVARLEASDLSRSVLEKIDALIASVEDASAAGSGPAVARTARARAAHLDAPRRLSIHFKPEEDALRNGMRPDLLIEELRAMGDVAVTYDTAAVPALEDLDPMACHIAWNVALVSAASIDDIRQVFIFAEDAALEIEEGAAETVPLEAPPPSQKAVAPVKQEGDAAAPVRKSAVVRVPAGRLDQLMDQLGEFVIAEARLDQIARRLGDPTLSGIVEEVARLLDGLRDATLSMRMLPIEVVFAKFARVVRALSDELGKDVRLVTAGGETELDKQVIDSLTEPLVHMIRNAIDHGIEAADRRDAAGKPPQGSIFLSARQAGGEVLISVADDGGGLDTDAIRARAIERGLISEGAEISDDQLHQMIFEPAFSTAKTLSSVSGRGVGMDAVRKAVADLRGQIDVETLPGRGSRITLRLPVTLAIIDGLLVRVGESIFVIPLSAVSECVDFSERERDRDRAGGRTLLQIRDELVPYLDLDGIFGIAADDDGSRRVVIVTADGRRVGLVVDDTLGQHQTVIKTFSRFHRDVEGFAGSTILGDGRVALILDVHALLRLAPTAHTDMREVA